jgi:twitching motility protein PilT
MAPLFRALPSEHVEKVVTYASLVQLDPGEALVREGDPSDAMYVVLRGEAAVLVLDRRSGESVQVTTVRTPDTVGEIGLLLEQPRSATVIARDALVAVAFPSATFHAMFQKIPAFGVTVARGLAARLVSTSREIPVREWDESAAPTPPADTVGLLPMEYLLRHRVVPLAVEGTSLTLGFVDTPDAATLDGARQLLPSLVISPVRIRAGLFEDVLRQSGGVRSWSDPAQPSGAHASVAPSPPTKSASPHLDQLLRRMVVEGASDLHLSAGHRPRWRIDGAVREIVDAPRLGADDVARLLDGAMDDRSRAALAENDVDFAYAIEGLARFRVNMFRDQQGVGAVLRVIPAKILTLEQLGVPPVVEALCRSPKGLVLVTGPTGSGKSTTLASMVDAINRTRHDHVITLEDPIEFVHRSQGCLVNQREVGAHTRSFARALKAALREDPDIVLVGEMRDLETVSLALETANTGHLVFGTLHTSTAVGTIDRIINLFPVEQQSQVRATLSETLRGVVAQTLCKKVGGGRVAALEVLVVNTGVANLIREGKSHQIPNLMSTGRAAGNQTLNDELLRLVSTGVVTFEEASNKAVDKADLARRCGR